MDDKTTIRAPRVTRARGESHSETLSHTSHTLHSLEEIRGAPAPMPAPVPPVPQPDEHVLEMRDVIQLLTRLMVAQARHQEVGIGHADRAINARVHDFNNLDPPVFTEADPNEDPQVFLDRMQRTLRVMKATVTESFELASYRLRDVTVNWYESWELSRGEDALPTVCQEFTEAFLRHYLPPDLRQARVDRFLTLRQGNMSVREYNVQFDSLARYAPPIAANMEDWVQWFMMGLKPHLLNDWLGVYYTYGYPGHVMRDCSIKGGAGIVQSVRSVASSSSSVCPPGKGSQAPTGRGRGRSGASSLSDPQNRSTLWYVTSLVASKFEIEPKSIKPFEVSTPVGDPVKVRRVYKDCIVVAHSHSIVANLIELDMVEFDVIMGMDWLASCYASVDGRSKMFRFQFPGEPILEWKAFLGHIILDEGIRVDTKKIEAVKTWPRPTTPTEKATKFQWIDAYERSFHALKDIMTSAPVLTFREGTDDYAIYCDASGLDWVVYSCNMLEKSKITCEIHYLANLGVRLLDSGGNIVTIQDTTTSSLVTKVKECQYEDLVLAHYRITTRQKGKTPFEITGDGVFRYRGRLCVPNVVGLCQQVLGEAHYSRYSIHLGATKMYHDIRGIYWWDGMKKDISEFVVQCPNCQ
ncbi:uncharacterized protein [Nicotiana tomentosiformis]|uniref:uncharacterized protein n=1 Tax=Nicotiana tomentosiformis TaxID=4098 RepID=UPI00388CE9C2